VSVLFADLVGFTALSEHRDPEEVRELLSAYFERCRVLIARYGGTVEKFIGDAVMAVWGSPVAREDDAERAVRAALALTRAVAALGDETGMPLLQARAGVLTGHAAVEVGAESEGMVLGDTVNTASRLQALAHPGAVLVDSVTRRASEAAIAYEDAGVHVVKGREQPVHAWSALRVVAGAGGSRRASGPEAPFVGRQRQLTAIIDASDDSARAGRARHVVVVGEAGAGKSRLLWEFFKHLDGVEEVRWWHQGRCLAYGEGVAFWALAEMVRSRAGILEEDPPPTARAKLHDAVSQHVADERERRLIEPRLAHLLRLEERSGADRADLFSGWRLFFERLSASSPVILAFEDLQWAESGLLEFIDYLLEWSAEAPIFVLSLGRPEVRERRPTWRALTLEPLDQPAIETMLDGLAPGLPATVVNAIVERSEGIPLYAVETIRMLLDRELLVQDGARYIVTGDLNELAVPETLHALAASRLDSFSAAERSLLQDASVLGRTFTAAGVAALSARPADEVTEVLDGLVTRQVLGRDDDPRSPRTGGYVFLQALLHSVTYETLGRRARKARHLAAARYLEPNNAGGHAEIAEVLAAHYLEAIRAEPDAQDVADLRRRAREQLTEAGRATASLALGPEAQRYFAQAAELTNDDLELARLSEWSGAALYQSGDSEAAEQQLRRAIRLYGLSGDASGGSAAVRLARNLRLAGDLDEARSLLEPFRGINAAHIDGVLRAEAMSELAAAHLFAGDVHQAGPLFDEALSTLEEQQAWPVLADVLVGHSVYFVRRHRLREGAAVLRAAIALAEERDLPSVVLRARYNLAGLALWTDRFEDAITNAQAGLALARERGDRSWEDPMLAQLAIPLYAVGRWDEAVEITASLITGIHDTTAAFAAAYLAQIAAARGDLATLERCRLIAENTRNSRHVDERASAALVLARDALERDAFREAFDLVRQLLDESHAISVENAEEAYALSAEAALRLPSDDPLAELASFVASLSPGRATPLLLAGRARVSAEQAQRRDDLAAAWMYEDDALAQLRAVNARPLLARALLERAWRHKDPAALAQGREIYTSLKADRWLAQHDQR
jgi:class 3 adenylate cyclase/predicted ATPase